MDTYYRVLRQLLCKRPWVQSQQLPGIVSYLKLGILHCPRIFMYSSLLGYCLRAYGDAILLWLSYITASDQHEVTRGLRRPLQNLHFTTVLDVRRARSDERVAPATICISPQFWTSDEHETTKGPREDTGRFAFHHSFGRPTSTK